MFQILTKFEQTMSVDSRKHLSKLYVILWSLQALCNKVKRRWEISINDEMSDAVWCRIKYFGQSFSTSQYLYKGDSM